MAKNSRNRKTTRKNNSRQNRQGNRHRQDRGKQIHERSNRTSPNKGLGGDVVEGRQAVRELLAAGNRRVREVVLITDLDPSPILAQIKDLALEKRVPLREVTRSKFDSLAVTESPQGVVSFAEPLPNLEIEDLLSSPMGKPFLLVMDGIMDPRNLGAMLRTAECAGVTGVLLPKHGATRITPAVTKTAQGAIEHLPIASVSSIPKGLNLLKGQGVWTVGLDADSVTDIYELEVTDEPVALVLGSEGQGLGRLSRERCDLIAKIPLIGSIDSLNVSAAAAVACFEIAKKRRLQNM
ncbi:MAG: 23S rRNA (guanosine(2251)-2'-O)-methyltransferase RlmB [Acidimicrobiaceae bacterium]|nr:23S rRNA (guanosine(2251)-2'-O)-methyltransferase RlmB [Acidimicrobiaceae bacterium]|tara:strand:- start:266 stop:1147 length:882 start_codon:yes stop_codon:yes gene_type:complete